MIYRRPNSFDESMRFLNALQTAKVEGAQKRLQDLVKTLVDQRWFEDALKPLYDANVVVQLVTHSLVPMLQEMVLEKAVLDEQMKAVTEEKRKARAQKYAAKRQELLDACKASRGRGLEVTSEYATMRDSMQLYAENDEVQGGLSMLYENVKAARTAIDLMNGRINEALLKHTAIEKSDDIPFEALNL
tara:strand:- start:115 stop:678 length:564 start_codon:yes stop_codon:yes gene_type:complete